MKVCYLTWGETPRLSGVFKSQVINQFIFIRNAMLDSEFYFISGLPIIHSGLVREKLNYINEIKKIKSAFIENNITFKIIPIFALQHFFNSSILSFNYMHYLSNDILGKYLTKIDPDVVHCRSYHATWAALNVRKKYKLRYKVVFDGRGFWPLEVAYKRSWNKLNKNFLFLEKIEQYNLQNADITIAVSHKMENYYIERNAKKTSCIYLSANEHELKPNDYNLKENSQKIIFCYVGALDINTWHKPRVLLEIYEYMRKQFTSTKLIIATQSNHAKILEVFKDIPSDELEMTSFKKIEELKNILQRSDFGILSLYKAETEQEKEQAEGVLAVKFVEYTMGGLPVIVNQQCGEAAYLAHKYNLGVSYDPHNICITKADIVNLMQLTCRDLIHTTAATLFSYENNARRYKEIYEELTKS